VLIRSLVAAITSTPARRPAPSRRPALEPLEDRRVPSFGPLVGLPVGQFPAGVAAADFNGDGRPDLATNTFDGLAVRLGNGNGTFQAVQLSPAAGKPLAARDLNGDGKTDLVGIAEFDLRVSLGNGDGTFQPPLAIVLPSQLPAGAAGFSPVQTPTSAAAADLNGDGHLDLIAGGYDLEEVLPEESYREDDYVNVALGTATGSFGPVTAYRVASTFNTLPLTAVLGAGDFDGDGRADVLVNDHGRLSVFVGNGNGTLQPTPRVSDIGFVGTESGMRVADFDHDGSLDALSGSNAVTVMRGNGDGTFSPGAFANFGALIEAVAVGDVNADGELDVVGTASNVVIASPDEPVTSRFARVMLGAGAGSFGPPIVSALGAVQAQAHGTSAVLADFDGDAFPELALTEVGVQWSGFGYSALAVAPNAGTWPPPTSPPPAITIGDVTVTEGNAGSRGVSFTVTLSAAHSQPVSVRFATAHGSATADDYQAAFATLTIPAGRTTGTIGVLVNGDRLGEGDETFLVHLSDPTNATIAGGPGVGTIVDDEPRISITDVSRAEGRRGQTTVFTFTVTLSAAYDRAVTLAYRTANGTATAGDNDYVSKSGTLTFAAGQTTKTVTVVVKGDNRSEADETFYLDLSGNSGNSLFARRRGVGTILNDD
jgi:hypothetical protein